MPSDSPISLRWPSTIILATFLVLPVFASFPMVDFGRMGQVGLAGAFAGLSLFNNSTTLSFDPLASSLLSRTGEGVLTTLGTTNSGGAISSGCAINDVFYFAGSFSSIGNTSASNVASYTPSSGTFAALGSNGPNGPIYSLYCDVSNSQLWVGGQFTSPGSSVAIWDTKSNSWSAPSFKGFSGAAGEVLSIAPNSSGNSLLFSGSFLTSFAANATTLNNTNNPNVPYSPGASPFSSSLVPIPLGGAEILGEPSSSNPQFSNILNILCPSGPDGPGNTWLAADGNGAVVTIRDFSSIDAYGVRLGNTFQSGYGTTTFRYVPSNGRVVYVVLLLPQCYVHPRQYCPDFVICQPINGAKHDLHRYLSFIDRLINLIPGFHFQCPGNAYRCADHSVRLDRHSSRSAYVTAPFIWLIRVCHQQREHAILLCTQSVQYHQHRPVDYQELCH